MTTTTRAPRDGEQEGVDYYFVSQDEFLQRAFVEKDLKYAAFYGTEVAEVAQKTKHGAAFVILTEPGYMAFKAHFGTQVVGILLQTSGADRKKMLQNRGEKKFAERLLADQQDDFDETAYNYLIRNEYGHFDETLAQFEKLLAQELITTADGLAEELEK